MSKKEKTKQVMMIESRDVGTFGMKEAGQKYYLPERVADQLIGQGLAEAVNPKSASSKKSNTSTSEE